MSDTSDARWQKAATDYDWKLPPPVHWGLRLPVIRHLRATFLAWRISQHEHMYRSMGMIPQGYDQWVLYGIWKGRC